MSEATIARRYAEGLSAVVTNDAELDPVLASLNDFADAYRASAELRTVTENPAIEADLRAKALDAVMARLGMPEVAASFVRALFKRRRMAWALESIEQFSLLCDQRLNRETAEITTAVELDDAQAEKVRHAVETFATKSIRPIYHVDPSIIGGVVVRVGGFVVDRSIKRELKRLKRDLLERE